MTASTTTQHRFTRQALRAMLALAAMLAAMLAASSHAWADDTNKECADTNLPCSDIDIDTRWQNLNHDLLVWPKESIHQNHFYSVERNSAGISDDVKLTARVTNWGPNTNELVVVTVSIPNRTLVLSEYPSFLPAGCSQSDVGSTGLSITCKP